MIVKVENEDGNFVRWDDCKSACIAEDKEGPGKGKGYLLICRYTDGTDATYPLDNMARVYFMNNEGQTIDSYEIIGGFKIEIEGADRKDYGIFQDHVRLM